MAYSILKKFYRLQEFKTCAVKLYSGKIRQWLRSLSTDLANRILLYVWIEGSEFITYSPTCVTGIGSPIEKIIVRRSEE
jgi:hypothetical protein